MKPLSFLLKERFPSTEAAENLLRDSPQFQKRPFRLRTGRFARMGKQAVREHHRRAHTRGRPIPLLQNQMVLIKEFARLQGLANESYTIAQTRRLLDVTRNDAHSGFLSRFGGFYELQSGKLANSVRVSFGHKASLA
jgi:hypothetical protein